MHAGATAPRIAYLRLSEWFRRMAPTNGSGERFRQTAPASGSGKRFRQTGENAHMNDDTLSATRIESDSMGEVEVPRNAYWGAQTERARHHFAIGNERFSLALLRAYARLKLAAAEANKALGEIDAQRGDWIAAAAAEVIAGRFDDQFPLQVWQSGSGTQTHMNLNEVIASRANELAGGQRGARDPVHPNDHVNRGQSTNDTFPTAMHVAAALELRDALLPALDGLEVTLRQRAEAAAGIVKIGRTHLQDATPIGLDQEIGGWLGQLRSARASIEAVLPLLYELAIGGTAVGTGLNAHPRFADEVVRRLVEATGLPFRAAPDRFAALAGHEALTALSGGLATLASSLYKIANDIRWLASGPRCGLGELRIPRNEPGSSIMPGKVNPSQCEALMMVCLQVLGNHATVNVAASQGNLQLNVCRPVIAYNVLQSLELLGESVTSFDVYCARGLEPVRDVLARNVERSLMLVTALAPRIGYDAAARIAEYAYGEGCSLREAAVNLGLVSGADFDLWVRPEQMLGPREIDPL